MVWVKPKCFLGGRKKSGILKNSRSLVVGLKICVNINYSFLQMPSEKDKWGGIFGSTGNTACMWKYLLVECTATFPQSQNFSGCLFPNI